MQTHLNDLAPKEIMPGFHGKFVHSERMTFAYWEIDAGASLPKHAHPHEQVVNMLKGEFELVVEGTSYILKPGMVFAIPSNASHEGKALTACEILDVFQPVREDYR